MVSRLASSHEADREVAKDLTQDILVAVWKAWPAFIAQCSERTYVARIAHHRIVTHIARAVKRPPHVELAQTIQCSDPTPEDRAIQSETGQALLAAVRRLPIAYREVAILLLEGLSITEVSDTIGLSQNAVSIRASRARQMLRDLLKGSL